MGAGVGSAGRRPLISKLSDWESLECSAQSSFAAEAVEASELDAWPEAPWALPSPPCCGKHLVPTPRGESGAPVALRGADSGRCTAAFAESFGLLPLVIAIGGRLAS